jgi:hypothetical protein
VNRLQQGSDVSNAYGCSEFSKREECRVKQGVKGRISVLPVVCSSCVGCSVYRRDEKEWEPLQLKRRPPKTRTGVALMEWPVSDCLVSAKSGDMDVEYECA